MSSKFVAFHSGVARLTTRWINSDNDEGSEERRGERRGLRRYNWEFMAWAFVTMDGLARANAAKAGAPHSDSDDASAHHELFVQTATSASDDELEPANVADGDNGSQDADYGTLLSLAPPPMLALSSFVGGLGGKTLAKSAGSSTLVGYNDGASGGGSSGGGSGGGTTTVPVGPGSGGDTLFNPTIDYFTGFDPFAEQLGFANGIREIATLAPEGSGAYISAALAFSDTPLAPVGLWAGLGNFDPYTRFTKADQFNAEYTVQATGKTDGELQHAQGYTQVDEGQLTQWGDAATGEYGNQATLVDGQDWGGALVVKGNYYEFNTIIQVNVIWSNGTFEVQYLGPDGGSAAVTPAAQAEPATIHLASNEQVNLAQIIEYANAADPAAPVQAQELSYENALLAAVSPEVRAGQGSGTSDMAAPAAADLPDIGSIEGPAVGVQVYAGGVTKNTAVIQQSILVDADSLSFAWEDEINGNDVQAVLAPVFANVDRGDQVQHNGSLVATADPISPLLGDVSVKEFKNALAEFAPTTTVEVVNGDYYEFNTIFQLNVVRDTQVETFTIGGSGAVDYGWGPGGDIVTAGGSMQFNAASLVKNDAHDYLYVGGHYSQYNLVMQVNALANTRLVDQISAVVYDGGGYGWGPSAVGGDDDSGGDGNGSNGGTHNSSQGDHALL